MLHHSKSVRRRRYIILQSWMMSGSLKLAYGCQYNHLLTGVTTITCWQVSLQSLVDRCHYNHLFTGVTTITCWQVSPQSLVDRCHYNHLLTDGTNRLLTYSTDLFQQQMWRLLPQIFWYTWLKIFAVSSFRVWASFS